jgi:hypothetical protein
MGRKYLDKDPLASYNGESQTPGEVAERLNAADSKSVLGKPNGGSNPPLSVFRTSFQSSLMHN